MFWCYENGDGNLAVAYASERYDDIRNYNSKISDFGVSYTTEYRVRGGVYVELGEVFR